MLVAGGASVLTVALEHSPVSAGALQSDRALLDLLAALEQAQIARYEAILAANDSEAFAAVGLPDETRRGIETILAAEEAHLAMVARPDAAPELAPPAPTDLIAALREATALEQIATAAYAGVIAKVEKPRRVADLLGIHSVEARQATWLATLLGFDPFPEPIDTPLTPEETLSRWAEFVGEPTAVGTPTDAAADLAPAVAAISQELGVTSDAVAVMSVAPRVWPDSSLGCPQPDMLYAQVVTPGFVISVEVAGEQLEFHADERGNIVRCP
jgi:hypothetical protein